MAKYLMIVAVLLLSACTNPEEAHRALTSSGFTDIQTGGYAVFACSKDDFYATSFTAKNSRGEVVSGTVCSGLLFKGATIRF